MRTASNTLFTGKVLQWLESVDSTNHWMQQYISVTNAAEGMVVLADHQKAGKGQQGAIWESEPGKNLLLSVLYMPGFLHASQVFIFNKAIALAVYATVQSVLRVPVFVKWPNDIYVQQQKIAGILIESALQGSNIKYCIAGIGLNVNQIFNQSTLANATSIAELCGTQIDRQKIFDMLCTQLEKYYLLLKSGNENAVEEQYQSVLYKRNEITQFTIGEETLMGKIERVDSSGKLHVNTATGLRIFEVKEVKYS